GLAAETKTDERAALRKHGKSVGKEKNSHKLPLARRRNRRDIGLASRAFRQRAARLLLLASKIPQAQGPAMQITWYGHSAFRLDFAGHAGLIDPFSTGNPAFASEKPPAARAATRIE